MSPQMKTVHCIYSFTMGGAETMLTDIVNRQSAGGDDVTLLVVNDAVDESMLRRVSPSVRVIRLGRRPGSRSPLPLLRLHLTLRRLCPDIIHCHSFNLLPVLPGFRDRLVYTIHDVGITDRYFHRCAALAAISEEVAREHEGKGWPVTVITNGIDFNALRRRPYRAPAAGEPLRVVNVGRLMAEKKGQDILLRAAAMLISRGKEVEVTLIGEGRSEGELRALAAGLGISGRVRFMGRRDRAEVYAALADYHAMCHPSRYEGFGLTVAEGMGAGLPVVVSDSGGPCEITAGGEFGKIFPTGDPAGCARALGELIDHYPTPREIEDARIHAVNHYSIDRMVADYRRLYRSVTATRRG